MKVFGSIIIGLIPIGKIRILLYKLFFRYKISWKTKIGMFNILLCKRAEMVDCQIGYFNLIICNNLKMEKNSLIFRFNRIKFINNLILKEKSHIYTRNFIGAPKKEDENTKKDVQNLNLGKSSEINRHNYFDVLSSITIGENVVFGGEGSEIWTHGFETNRNLLVGEVSFGDNIFVGSKCIFTKNVRIGNNVTIGPGSVIYKSIIESGFYTTHQINKVK